MKWRILHSGRAGSAENMAVDEAIFLNVIDGLSDATIRFYDWDPPTVSIGYNQDANKEIDFSALEKYGFGFVRRPTGGRMVLHHNEITYSVIAPIKEKLKGNITESYSEISKALALGLKFCGIDVEFEKGNLTSASQRESINPCFNSSSRFELTCQKKKIVGSAQVRKGNFLLQHGSILLDNDQSFAANLIPGLDEPQKDMLAKLLTIKTVSINQVADQKLNFEEAASRLERGFMESWNTDRFYRIDEPDEHEKAIIRRLIDNKYSTIGWNMKKME